MSRARRRDGEETPWASFSDALSGMLFVFVITTFWFALQLAVETNRARTEKADYQSRVEKLTNAAQEARDLVADEQGAKGLLTRCLDESPLIDAKPERASARVSLYLSKEAVPVQWFEECQSSLGADQTSAANSIRGCLAQVYAAESSTYNVRVFLEGHTDAQGVGGCPSALHVVSNWELSGARAAAVTRAVLDERPQADAGSSISGAVGDGQLQLLAVGLADTRPAWGALCARIDRLTDLDREICPVLSAGAPVSIAAALDDAALGACTAGPGNESCSGTSDPAKLCRWANWCPDADGTGDDRRGLLRRVDLRVELDPRVPTAMTVEPG